MPSKELIALAANAMEERRKELIAQPLSRIYPQLAEAAISTILAALLEPTEEMKEAWMLDMDRWISEEIEDEFHPWRVMLAASALGEQSDGV